MSELYLTGNGGGATTVALVTGNLSTLSSAMSSILVVAAGGGGSCVKKVDNVVVDVARGGNGGGFVGGNPEVNGIKMFGLSGTQTDGYAFGQGQAENEHAGGGGSGLYGGYNETDLDIYPAFAMNDATGDDSVRYNASDIVISESGVTICHGGFGDINSLSNPYATFADGVMTIESYSDGARGWVYDTSVNHNIIPPNCLLKVKLDIQYVVGSDFDLYFSSTSNRVNFANDYNVMLDYGSSMSQKTTGTWYSTEFQINMVNGILQNYTFYVNDTSTATGTLNQHMVNVDETGSLACSIIGIKIPSSTVKIRNFTISWEERV